MNVNLDNYEIVKNTSNSCQVQQSEKRTAKNDSLLQTLKMEKEQFDSVLALRKEQIYRL